MKFYPSHVQKLLGLCFLVGFSVQAMAKDGEVKMDISLVPTGEFQAANSKVKGTWKKGKGGEIRAKNISLEVNGFKTGLELRDKHLIEEYMEAKKYPKAVLKSATGKDGKFSGQLMVHGVTQEITGTYKIEGSFVVASFVTNLKDYKIKDVNYQGVGVNEEISVTTKVAIK